MEKATIQHFFDEQMAAWEDCAKRYRDLEEACRKSVSIDGREYTLMFNPARMRSATAKVTAGKVERPCFLCRNNRPDEQKDIHLTPPGSEFSYLLSVNPFPILPNHFTVINDGHCRQTMTLNRLRDMAFVARELEGYLVFFNGACSGASAPDHFHFQAVPQELVPLVEWGDSIKKQLGVQYANPENVKIDFSRSDNTNILCWNTPEGLCWWVVNRRCHRPWQYSAEGEEKVLISPASLEFAGVVPLAREEDFLKMSAPLLKDIYDQCKAPNPSPFPKGDKGVDTICNREEPLVDVGISKGHLEGVANDDGTTTIDGVRIGIGFHWDQKRTFRYEGDILYKVDPDTGEEWTVNRLSVERYLKSVISSEMSATSSLELLKAHAVISRSWLLFGSAPHTLFDVCSDDCCQRYQGISDKMNPLVEQAIEETRGEVLMYDGKICDARYSKCCGGRTEEFRYCWENLNIPYLQSVEDKRPDGTIFCDTENKEILPQVLNDYDQTTRDFFHWKVEYTQEELSELIERKLHKGLGRILDIIPLERGKSGRISQLKIIGENGETIIGKELAIRKTLSETCLYSSAFEISPLLVGEGSGVRLLGTGWGHGVGLCQIGAAVMGAEGYDYKQILAHYYKNTEIKKLW